MGMNQNLPTADIQDLLDNIKGPVVEIGGPTPEGFTLLGALALRLPSKPVVTNIENPVTLNPFGDNPTTYEVDDVVDVRNMKYGDGSVGMILACALPYRLHKSLIAEAARVLESGGLLLIEQAVTADGLEYAQDHGFDVLYQEQIDPKPYYNIIFQK